MANPGVAKAAGGAGDSRAALPRDSPRVDGVYYFNVISSLFLKSIFLAVLLCKRGASPQQGEGLSTGLCLPSGGRGSPRHPPGSPTSLSTDRGREGEGG